MLDSLGVKKTHSDRTVPRLGNPGKEEKAPVPHSVQHGGGHGAHEGLEHRCHGVVTATEALGVEHPNRPQEVQAEKLSSPHVQTCQSFVQSSSLRTMNAMLMDPRMALKDTPMPAKKTPKLQVLNIPTASFYRLLTNSGKVVLHRLPIFSLQSSCCSSKD
ncbi:hypothetical protein H920_12921 [Fukomys damarensis]|uniref:Uncharacterized protein n=1 Tax=Fukomys damarensis TaxID=885580 RepID=A0A091D6C6_FUKDA|nr:hypothetical protein H920_12921 [Fukomys damarensis]